MLCPADTFIGLLLGLSVFFLILSSLGYWRSGVRTLLLLSEGLVIHVAFTVILLIVAHATEWLADVDCSILVLADAALLLVVILFGYVGGRFGVGPS